MRSRGSAGGWHTPLRRQTVGRGPRARTRDDDAHRFSARRLDVGPRGARKQYMDSVMRLARRDVPVPVRAGFCDSTSILGFTA